ncbi:MAG: hypothetical protein ACPL4H_09470 [Anaerolineales bacterium]
MFKIGRAFIILLILLIMMGLIGWGIYSAVQSGFSGVSTSSLARHFVLDGDSVAEKGLGIGVRGGVERNNSSFASESSLLDQELKPLSIGLGLAGLLKNILVIGVISLVVGGSEASIHWLRKRSTQGLNQERIGG